MESPYLLWAGQSNGCWGSIRFLPRTLVGSLSSVVALFQRLPKIAMGAKALNDQIRHLCAQVIMAQDDEIEPILTTSQLLIPYMILRAVKCMGTPK